MPFILPVSFPFTVCNGSESEQQEMLDNALQALPKEISNVLNLHYEQNISIKEIAVMIGKSVSTVRHRHNYGLFLIEEYFKKHCVK